DVPSDDAEDEDEDEEDPAPSVGGSQTDAEPVGRSGDLPSQQQRDAESQGSFVPGAGEPTQLRVFDHEDNADPDENRVAGTESHGRGLSGSLERMGRMQAWAQGVSHIFSLAWLLQIVQTGTPDEKTKLLRDFRKTHKRYPNALRDATEVLRW